MNVEQQVFDRIGNVLASSDSRWKKAQQIAELIRSAREYRWVGIYRVDGEEIAAIAWGGPGEPAYPCFPASQGLCGAAVRSGAAVVVAGMTKDAPLSDHLRQHAIGDFGSFQPRDDRSCSGPHRCGRRASERLRRSRP